MEIESNITTSILDYFVEKLSCAVVDSLEGRSFFQEIDADPYVTYLKSGITGVAGGSGEATLVTIEKLFELLQSCVDVEKHDADNSEQKGSDLHGRNGGLNATTKPKFVIFFLVLLSQIVTQQYPNISLDPTNPIVSIFGTHRLRTSLLSVSTEKIYYFAKRMPSKLGRDKAERFLSVLISLMSSRFPVYEYQCLLEEHDTASSYDADNDWETIDNLCGNLLAFVAHSNPEEYFSYVTGKLQSTATVEQFCQYAQLLEYCSLDGGRLFGEYFDFLFSFCKHNSHNVLRQKLVFINFTRAIKYWISSDLQTYLEWTSTSDLHARDLFFYMVQFLPRNVAFGYYDLTGQRIFARSLSLLLCLSPALFERYISSEGSDKDRRLQFLRSIIVGLEKGIYQEPSAIDCADSFVLITGIASIICQSDRNHPVLGFVKLNLDPIFSTLNMLNVNLYNFEHLTLTYDIRNATFYLHNVEVLDELRICFFSFQSILDPDFFLDLIVEVLNCDGEKSLHRLLMFISGLRLYYEVSCPGTRTFIDHVVSFLNIYVPNFVHLVYESRKNAPRSVLEHSSSSTVTVDTAWTAQGPPLSPRVSRSRTPRMSRPGTPGKARSVSPRKAADEPAEHASKSGKLYGETVSLAKALFKHEKKEKVQKPYAERPHTIVARTEVDSGSYAAASNTSYQLSMLDPVNVSKKVLYNLFTIIKLTRLVFIPALFGGLFFEGDPESEEAKVCLTEYRRRFEGLLQAIICGLREAEDVELLEASKEIMMIFLDPLLFYDCGKPYKDNSGFSTAVSYSIDFSNRIMLELVDLFELDDPKLCNVLLVIDESFQKRYQLMKDNYGLFTAETSNFGLKNRDYLLRQLQVFEQFFFYVSNSTSLQAIQIMGEINHLIELEMILWGLKQKESIFQSWPSKDFFSQVLKDHNITGIALFRKKIKTSMLRYLTQPNESLYKVWMSLYRKWETYNESQALVYHSSLAYSGTAKYLAMCCGNLLGGHYKGNSENNYENNYEDATSCIDNLIQFYVDSLESDDKRVQLLAKAVLTEELHPNAYEIAAFKLQAFAERFYSKEDAVEKTLVLSGILLSTIKMIIATNNTLLIFKLSGIIVHYVHMIINSFNKNDFVSTCSLKISLAALFAENYPVKAMLNLGDIASRNFYVKNMMKWLEECVEIGHNDDIDQYFDLNDKKPISSSTSQHSDTVDDAKSNHNVINQSFKNFTPNQSGMVVKLSQTAAKALVNLSEGLPLAPNSYRFKEDLQKEKEKMIDDYFSIIFPNLNHYIYLLDSNKDLVLKQKLEDTLDNLISGLSNLFIANIDIALGRSVALGYHPVARIKLLFFKIFANIIRSTPGSEQESWHSLQSTQALERLFVDLLVRNPDLLVAFAESCPSSQVDYFARAVLDLYGSRGQSVVILDKFIELEAATVQLGATFLRGNTICPRILYLCTRTAAGNDYLRRTVTPVLEEIVHRKEYFTADDNPELLVKYLCKLVRVIRASDRIFPPLFRRVCHALRKQYRAAFGADSLNVVGAFVFLKYICPAIVNPEVDWSVRNVTPNRAEKASFMLLARFLQGVYGPSMLGKNKAPWPAFRGREQLVVEMRAQVLDFFQSVSSDSPEVAESCREHDRNEVTYLRGFLHDNILQIRSAYLWPPRLPGRTTLECKYSVFEQLDAAVLALGPPSASRDYVIPESVRTGNERLYNFMSSYSMADVEKYKQIPIVREGTTSEGMPVVVFSYYYYQKHRVDPKLTIYMLLQAMLRRPAYYIIVDVTEYADTFALLPTGLLRSLMTDDMMDSVLKVYYLNCNSTFIERVQSCAVESQPFFFFKSAFRDVLFTSMLESPRLVSELPLLKHSREVASEPWAEFRADVYMAGRPRRAGSVLVGRKYVLVTLLLSERYLLNGGEKIIKIIDVHHLKAAQFFLSRDTEFVMTVGSKRYVLLSPRRLEILKRFHVNKSKLSQKLARTDLRLGPGPNGVAQHLGDLLNVVFAGILHDSEPVRAAANGLLCDMAAKLRLPVSLLCNSHSDVVPRDHVAYVLRVSAELAEGYQELTSKMFKGFFRGAAGGANPAYIVPWAANVLPVLYYGRLPGHVSVFDSESVGIGNCVAIVRELLRLGGQQDDYFSALSPVWRTLLRGEDDGLVELVFQEVVAAAIEYASIDKDWDQLITVVTANTSLKSCARIVHRLVAISVQCDFADTLETRRAITEVEVLMRMCLYLLFQALQLSKAYFPELLYSAMVYVNLGPRRMKAAVYQLACLVFGVFAESNDKAVLTAGRGVLDYLSGDTAKLVFGLYDSNAAPDRARWSSNAARFRALGEQLSGFLGEYPDCNTQHLWTTRWARHVYTLVFRGNGVLQGRGIILFGSLANTETLLLQFVPRMAALPVLRTGGLVLHSENYVAAVYAVALCVRGLPLHPDFLFFCLWGACSAALFDDLLVYETALTLMHETLARIHRAEGAPKRLVSRLFSARKIAGPSLPRLEALHGFRVTRKNHQVYFAYLLFKGARTARLKPKIAAVLLLLLRIYGRSSPAALTCLYFAIAPSSEFRPFAETKPVSLADHDGLRVPAAVANHILHADRNSHSLAVLILLSYYYNAPACEPAEKIRVLLLFKYIAEHNPGAAIKLYPQLRDMLSSARDNSFIALQLISDIFNSIAQSGLAVSEHQSAVDIAETLRAVSLQGISNYTFYQENTKLLAEPVKLETRNRQFSALHELLYDISLHTADHYVFHS